MRLPWGALPDVAVSPVEEGGGPGPRRAEREDILVARQPLPLRLEGGCTVKCVTGYLQ